MAKYGGRSTILHRFAVEGGCKQTAGTNPHPPRFLRMKIREENCNMFLLAVVTVFTVIVAASSSLVGASDKAPPFLANRTEPAPAAGKPVIHVTDLSAVSVVGTPFIPNTHPRE